MTGAAEIRISCLAIMTGLQEVESGKFRDQWPYFSQTDYRLWVHEIAFKPCLRVEFRQRRQIPWYLFGFGLTPCGNPEGTHICHTNKCLSKLLKDLELRYRKKNHENALTDSQHLFTMLKKNDLNDLDYARMKELKQLKVVLEEETKGLFLGTFAVVLSDMKETLRETLRPFVLPCSENLEEVLSNPQKNLQSRERY